MESTDQTTMRGDMIIKKACKATSKSSHSYIGLDERGSLWLNTGSSDSEGWKPVLFNEVYEGYYPKCCFTAVGVTDMDFIAAGIDKDGIPYVYRSLMGGVWEAVNLLCGSRLTGYKRASGKIVTILYDAKTKQLFMPCENGEMLTIPDCPKCAKINKVSDDEIMEAHFSEDNAENIILLTRTGKEIMVALNQVLQIRVSKAFAMEKVREGGALLDLRKIEEEEAYDWLCTQPKDKFIVFICEYGVRSDRAAIYARNRGYDQAYSLGEKIR